MEGLKRSRAHQTSTLPQHAVHPPAQRRRETTSALHSAGRQSVQPSVCAVHPGRVLELRTTLGLLKARQMMEQQVTTASEPTQTPPQVRNSSRAQLKSARLQPLGIVDDESLASQICLGIIPEKTRRYQRPRSSTAPDVHFNVPSSTESEKRVSNTKRRTQSAIFTRTVDTDRLMKLLSISKHTALVPHKIPRETQDSSLPIETTLSDPNTGHEPKPLPPAIKHGELGIKVEVRGLREIKPTDHSSAKSNTQDTSPKEEHSPPGKPPLPIKLTEQKSMTQSSSSHSTAVTYTQPVEPMRVSVVSVAEKGPSSGEQERSRQAKRKSSGRLSRGWSPPQSIQPLTGRALNKTSVVECSLKRTSDKMGVVSVEDRGTLKHSNSMIIEVNINDFLHDN